MHYLYHFFFKSKSNFILSELILLYIIKFKKSGEGLLIFQIIYLRIFFLFLKLFNLLGMTSLNKIV